VKLAELAQRLGTRLEGDGSIDVFRVAGIDDAGPGDVTFLANPRYASRLASTRASAVIASDRVSDAPCAVLRSAHPYVTFADAVAVLTPPAKPEPGINSLAAIDPTAELGPDVSIGPFVVIGPRARIGARTVLRSHVAIGQDATIGDDCLLHPHVSVREAVTIGHRVVLQNACVIGADGFGFATRPDGTHQKIPQVGSVVIEDDVEIGAQSVVDRPAVGITRVGAGTKIDNLVQIAHGVRIGRNVLLAAQVGIAGSSVLEDDVVLAGQAGVINHVHVGRGVKASAQTGITSDTPPGLHVAGMPSWDAREWRTAFALVRRLPEFRRRLRELTARLDALK
jgi:UDP-3-O-[3-hydroxymyristoyl] glucosamine N-acyltransferase